MNRWYLLTDEFDSMENCSPDCTDCRMLLSETFEQAKEEALALYRLLPRYKPGAYARHREFPTNPRLCIALTVAGEK